jgi:hypothetical protein
MELSDIDAKLIDRLLEAVEGLNGDVIALKRTMTETRKMWTLCGRQLATSTKTVNELQIEKKAEG